MYYKIEHNTDVKVSGSTYPQAECLTLSNAHSIKFDEFSNPDNLKLEFKLASRAKLTDVLSQAAISAHGLLINQKVRDILEGFNLMQHQYYPVNVVTKKSIEQYYWLHLVDNSFVDKIDYNTSTFFWTRSSCRKEMIQIKSFENYQELKMENGILWGAEAEKIRLNELFDYNLDLIGSLYFLSGVYISESIYDRLIEKGISGLKIKDAENISL